MPHVVLEYSADLEPVPDLQGLFLAIHSVCVDVAGAGPDNIKSRAYAADMVRIGDGDRANAFAHLDVRLMEGRTTEVKAEVSDACLSLLVSAFGAAMEGRDVQITVEVSDLERSTYSKYPPGSMPPLR